MSYFAAVVSATTKNEILSQLRAEGVEIPAGWDIVCHHVTLAFGREVKDCPFVEGFCFPLDITHIGYGEKVIAVKVSGVDRVDGGIPHVTIAVDRENGGKPVMSNQITDWREVTPFPFLAFGEVCD